MPWLGRATGGRGSLLLLSGALIALALVAAASAVAASAAPRPVGGPRALAVSVPPEPVRIPAGGSAKTTVRVVNPNAAPVTVTIVGRALTFGNDGRVEVGPRPDPRWRGLKNFPSGTLKIPAEGYLDIPLTIHLPGRIPPDLYFVGFLVTPVSTSPGNVQVINQIGSFLAVDVPGARVRKLTAAFNLPRFVLGSRAHGTVRIRNAGRAAVRFWGENDTTSSPGGSVPSQQRYETSLLPIGLSRSLTVSGKPAWPVGMVTMTVHLTYPDRTENATKEIIFTKRVLVVSPWVLVALAILLASAVVRLIRRRHRKRLAGRAPSTA